MVLPEMEAARPPRKVLSGDGLVSVVREAFEAVPDPRQRPQIAVADALMAGFALFSLKSPSLLAFENERQSKEENFKGLFQMQRIPSDTQMRAILDELDPLTLRPAFTDLFRQLQRGKLLEPYEFWNGHYLLASDGTEYFGSETVHCENCLEKRSRNGVVRYHHNLLGMAIMHPDLKPVIPLCPEPIVKQDGDTKNDGERSATRRALTHFRREHPHLKVIMVEDALSGNAPHIEDLQQHDIRFLLGIKPGSHEHLFDQLNLAVTTGRAHKLIISMPAVPGKAGVPAKPATEHHFLWVPDVELNKSHRDSKVTLLDHQEISEKARRHFTWITDLPVNDELVYLFMRGGRARWSIENETFNTLKNQGYHFEHNFGHGEKSLSTILALLMMLAFFVDQIQQLCDPVFQTALAAMGSKRRLWEHARGLFIHFRVTSFRQLYTAIARKLDMPLPADLTTNTS